jgi:N6-L-threonylcarbamoyladenine synthase
LPLLPADRVRDLAAAYQEAVVDVLVAKLCRAAARVPVQSLCIGGGVARNGRLRARLQQERALAGLDLALPEPALCSDNGAMIAFLGHLQLAQGRAAPLDLDAVATPQAGGKAARR